MHFFYSVPILSLFSAAVAASNTGLVDASAPAFGTAGGLVRRALPNSPSRGYAPATVDCPSNRPTIRNAASISTNESQWLKTRRAKTVDPMVDFLRRSNITDFDAEAYITSVQQNLTALPNIGIAISGGGYRALMNGAGFLAAADSRVAGSLDSGLGGIMQASTYLAGLSGGGWLVGSIYANNYSTVEQLRDGSSGSAVWAFDRNIFEGPEASGISILNTASYWYDIEDQVQSKRDAHFDTSITDYWGRSLSYQLINATDGGPAYTFSSIAKSPGFTSADHPLPILVADGRQANTKIISLNATVYEFNPWEMGSFDPTLFAFAPLEHLGSNFSGGSISTGSRCVSGFDQYGFVMGTSSSLFNQFMLTNLSSFNLPSIVTDAISSILSGLGDSNNDIAQYTPNPFFGYNSETNYNAGETELILVDGGEDLQNIPLHPLIQPERGVDVIFAIDSSADTTYNWPNGTALRASWERSFESIGNGTQFPAVPDAETFINLGLNSRPTFFGCDVNNFTSDSPVPPLIVYVPNTPYTAWSNVSTFTPTYSDSERNNIIQNGFNVATMGNSTVGSDWRTCAGCAVLQRSFVKTGTNVPPACQRCFDSYCWNGTVDSTPVVSYEPTPKLDLAAQSAASRSRFGSGSAGLGLVFGVMALVVIS
ncbi:lysophospholipase [Pseudomassariella vexata]|uniref:Lysophospholipase n=1 Tax=Pseudomassariella vexata TaxID=1141098 RepID=A0A1Y2DD09_9PEZI|nr:lysophospholipase [Pseudomassariella vexata]ORY57151.1 lysophospholipase [Pseudomassariella vexata]